MRRRPPIAETLAANYVLIGALTVLMVSIAVFISYNAGQGLPFLPTYDVSVDVPNAAKLTRGSDVRIGGSRIGHVLEIRGMPAEEGGEPFARLKLRLDESQELPLDSRIAIRPGSLLGAKYVDVVPGEADDALQPGGVLDIENTDVGVELDEAFNVFDNETAQGVRGVITGLGDALAGRGPALNETIVSAGELVGPLERVMRNLADEDTRLARLIRGTAAAAEAFEPVADELGTLFDDGATTLEAIDRAGPALGETLRELPRTEIAGTTALRAINPVLRDAAFIAREIRPGSRFLPTAIPRLDASVRAGIPALRAGPGALRELGRVADSLTGLSNGSAPEALRQLIATMTSLDTSLEVIAPAQTVCNGLGVWTRNTTSSISEGDDLGGWFRMIPVIDTSQIFQQSSPSPNLHVTPYPNQTAQECEAGNEEFVPGRQIGNPPGNQPARTEETSPPAGVRELAEGADLLNPITEVGR